MKAAVIHIVDDDAPIRTALTRLLRAKGYEVRTYSSAGDFLIASSVDGPGCLILDLKLPGPSGLDLQQALGRNKVNLPIIFLTGHGTVESGVRAMKAGAVDFLIKPVEPEKLLLTVETALARNHAERAMSENIAKVRARYAVLTARERAIFDGVVAGRLNKQISADLGITVRTVKEHRAHVMTKMNAGSVAELVKLASLLRSADTGASVSSATD